MAIVPHPNRISLQQGGTEAAIVIILQKYKK